VVAYVCEDCGARFDIVVEETDDESQSGRIS
jgi:predicted nucleic acid-binding Zn ribbon protein